jgi:NADH-quinone oxidoreductase subunit G
MEITTYLEEAVDSEMSGNVIDLCPVGALTSKPYAFTARPWELRRTETIDAMDAVGSNIRVDSRGREVMRILPRLHEDVNEEWLSDRSRFVWDGLRTARLDKPYVRRDGKLKPASWEEAFDAIAQRLDGRGADKIAALAGDMAGAESLFAAKSLLTSLGVANLDCRQDGAQLAAAPRQAYLFNTTIAGIEDADALLLVGSNPRWEAPVLNARFRKRALMGGFKAAYIGPAMEHTFRAEHIGAGPDTLQALVNGSHPFADVLKNAERPMLVLGQGALARPDGTAILALTAQLAERTGMLKPAAGDEPGWNGFNVLHTAAARVGALDLGFVPQEGGRDIAGILEGCRSGAVDTVFLLGADEIAASDLGEAFVVYLGHHGDAGAHRADVILPGAAYTEQSATYVNTEGRVQVGRRAAFPPGEAREDWAILRALSDRLGKTLPFDTLEALRTQMRETVSVFNGVDYAPGADGVGADLLSGLAGQGGTLDAAPFAYVQASFYTTNPVARASATMHECAETFGQTGAASAVAAE